MMSANAVLSSTQQPDVANGNAKLGAKTILVPLDTYLPGYRAGGPIRSVANLVEALGEELTFRIITLDRDLGDKEPFADVPTNRWVRVGDADVMYMKPGLGGFLRAFRIFRSLDKDTILYLNSTFGRRSSILPVCMRYLGLSKPRCIVLAPRGGFSPGALGINPNRKQLYLRILRWVGVYDHVIWHACNELERENIQRTVPEAIPVDPGDQQKQPIPHGNGKRTALIFTAPEIPITKSCSGERQPKKAGVLRLLFISRIAPMKNLTGALEILQGVSGNVVFDIYGPREDEEYWRECQRLIKMLPQNISVNCLGPLRPDQIVKTIGEHDLFFLPTLGEGYGHAIFESLAAGCPVLISDQTPWHELETDNAGWDIPLHEKDQFRRVLNEFAALDEQACQAYSNGTARYLEKHVSNLEIIDTSRKLFQLADSWSE